MKTNVAQNRLVIELARECLHNNGFTNPYLNKHQGTFPAVNITTRDPRNGVEYLVGITGRVETTADGAINPAFNLVQSADDLTRARDFAKNMNRVLAFVAVAFREKDASYAAYFDELTRIGFRRAVPMLPSDRAKYRLLATYTPDPRVKAVLDC
jgi:hypothetical protein